MKIYLISITLLLAFPGCTHKAEEKSKTVDLAVFTPPVLKADRETTTENFAIAKTADNADIKITDDAIHDTSKKIIKNGTIQFETSNINSTRKAILQAVKKYGGYVDEDNQSTNSDANRKEYNLKISIPAKYFDLLVDSVSGVADKIDSKNISITDVTTRYIDMKTRLDNKKLLENRYLELLKKGSKISDLLEIENKLTEIRSDIESTQGQLNYLNKQVAYSFLDITFYTQHVEKADKGMDTSDKFKTAVVGGWVFLQNLFFGIISLWPITLIIIIIYLMIKKWRKKQVRTVA